jgi:uncharacterized protein (TIGR03437 family)
MAASPEGQYAVLFTGTGSAYLYNAMIDDFTVTKQIFTAMTGLLGPVTAGPNGLYFVVNGVVLNSSLTPVLNIPDSNGGTRTTTSTSRPISAVAAVSASTYAIFTQPIRSSSSSSASDAGVIQIMNASTGGTLASANALETAASVVTGSNRVVTNGRTMVVDGTANVAYAITISGLSVIPMSTAPVSARITLSSKGVLSVASQRAAVAANEIASVFGTNLAADGSVTSGTLPTVLGGSCVTVNNQAVPLMMTSAGQINFQVPPGLAPGRYPVIVRSVANQSASGSVTVTVAKYAPKVMLLPDGSAAIYHSDGKLVTKDNPTTRDQRLVIYAAGLGPTNGGAVTPGNPSPGNPLAVTAPVSVYFGPIGYSQAPVVVEWSGLVPGLLGVYQIDVYVPGTHMKGDAVGVFLKIGGVTSPTTGMNLPTIAEH